MPRDDDDDNHRPIRRKKSSPNYLPWIIGGAVLAGLLALVLRGGLALLFMGGQDVGPNGDSRGPEEETGREVRRLGPGTGRGETSQPGR